MNPKTSIKIPAKKITTPNKKSGDIIIYQNSAGNIKLDVYLENETVWLNQEQMGILLNKARRTIGEHIQNIFKEGELDKNVVQRKFRHTTKHGAIEGKTQQTQVSYYNLDVIISVGYRVKSKQGTQFRIWATNRLREYIVKGFLLNDDRFKSGNSMNYFMELQNRIREIRLSERFFYQKIKDIYTTSIDYDSTDKETQMFFKIVQNKLIWAISKQTAAEIVYKRANANLPLMGMQSWGDKSSKKITKKDISISKNYLSEKEIKLLGLLVEQYLAFAETMAQQQRPMYMKDWIIKLDSILQMNGRELLDHAGQITRQQMIQKSEDEYQQYKEKQKKLERKDSLKELEEDLKQLAENTKNK